MQNSWDVVYDIYERSRETPATADKNKLVNPSFDKPTQYYQNAAWSSFFR